MMDTKTDIDFDGDFQLLVIQEKFNISKKHWKLPGGLADKGMGNSKSRNTLSLAEIHL
jgi:hypothetical protein